MHPKIATFARILVYCTFSIFCIYLLSELAYLRFFHMAGDSAGYVDLINRVSIYGDMRSNVFMSPYPLFDLMGKSALEYCASSFDNKYFGTSFYHLHSYLAVYLFSAINNISGINSLILASYINGIATFIVFCSTYLISRNCKLSQIESITIISAFLLFMPLVGSISGQFYYDRLFIPLALLGFYFTNFYNGKNKLAILIIIIIFTSLISERSALMIGILFIYLNIFTKNYKLILISSLSILYYLFWAKYIQSGLYSGSTSLQQLIHNFSMIFEWKSEYSIQTRNFLLVLSPLLVISAFSKRFFWICLIFIVPNLIVTVGGAEKNGYVSHYHTFYIPILIIGTIIGYSNLKAKINSKFTIVILFTIIIINSYFTLRTQFVVSPTLTHSISTDLKLLIPNSDMRTNSDNRKKLFSELMQGVNTKSTISASEFIMPMLVNLDFYNIRYFPIGIYNSDYLITESISLKDEFLLTIVSSEAEKNKIEECIHKIVLERYEDYRSVEIGGLRYRLWKIK